LLFYVNDLLTSKGIDINGRPDMLDANRKELN
jgi:hypothetical protein